MSKSLRFVGLDVHKASITVAVCRSGREPARVVKTIENELPALLEVLMSLGPMR